VRPLLEIEHDAAGFAKTRFRATFEVLDNVDGTLDIVAECGEDEVVIGEDVDAHVAEPLARILNDHGDLVEEVRKLRQTIGSCHHWLEALAESGEVDDVDDKRALRDLRARVLALRGEP
jgi:hypothetical protein